MNSFWGTQGQQSTSANDETPITANFWESSAAPPDPGPDEKSANFWESSVKPEISGLPDEWLAFEFWTGEMIQNEGPGNSIIVVGQAAPNQYTQADIDRPLGVTNADLSNLVSLEDINGYAGEQQVITDLPGGVNRLFLYGDVDLTSYNLAHIDWILPVRSQVSFTAQQLANLDPAVLYGDTRDSILRISNDSDQPITLNLDARIFTNFNALEIGEGVTLVVDQMALNGLQYISGEGAIQASNNARNLDFDGIFLTAAAQDRFGREIDPTETGGTRLDGQVLIAKNAGETLVGGEGNDRLIGGSGDNVLDATAGGDNILRAGAGRNEMYGGEGDDIFVLLGDLSVGGKQDDDFSTFLLGEPLSDLNGQNWALGASGVIDGGGGDNALHVFGDVDLTNYEIRHIDKIIVRSDVIFTTDQLEGVREMQGDGRSVITINSRDGQPAVFDLSELNLQGVGQIEIGASVTLEVDSLEDLGGARILTGQGTLRGKDPDHPIELTEEYTALNTVTVENADGTDARGQSGELDEVIAARRPGEIFNSDSNNYLVGTEYADVFVLDKNGDDVVNARAGDDTFIISGRGTKILMSSDGTDTIDLSQAAGPAVIDLTMGGKIAASETEIQLGTAGGRGGVFQEAPENNVMIIFDTSASMNVGTRRADAIDAANNLLDAYDNLGDVAVRFVTFDAGASAEFPASFSGGAWMDVSTAKDIITNIQTPGSATNFEAALNQAMQAYDVNQGNVYFPDGQGHSFFLSDGDENRGNVFNVQDQWQQFLIDNQVISNAIGFGGATRLDKLHPIAFNGVTGEDLDASLTLDSSQLGELVLGQAALDFIENLTGTPYDDALTGNALDNVIIGTGGDNIFKGLGGDDTLIGTPDGHDVAVYRGNLDEYVVTQYQDYFEVRDTVAGRDGVDRLYDIDKLEFADGSKLLDDIDVPPVQLKPEFLEFVAREIAYQFDELQTRGIALHQIPVSRETGRTDFQDGDVLSGALYPALQDYEIDKVFQNFQGLDAVALVSKTSSLPPILAFRGTAGIVDIISDVHPKMVGYNQLFDGSGNPREELVDILDWAGGQQDLHITGHSLGGALSQAAAVYLLSENVSVEGLMTFNPPAITMEKANRYDELPEDQKINHVHHFVGAEDLVSKVGEALLSGNVSLVDYDKSSFFVSTLMDAHTLNFLGNAAKLANYEAKEFPLGVDQQGLTDQSKSYYNFDFRDWFLFSFQTSAAAASAAAAVGPVAAVAAGTYAMSTLATRESVESARSGIGEGLFFVIDAIDWLADTVASALKLGKEFVKDALLKGKEAASFIAEQVGIILDGVQQLGEWILDKGNAFIDGLKSAGGEVLGFLGWAAMQAGGAALDGLKWALDKGVSFTVEFVDFLIGLPGHVLQSLLSGAEYVWDALINMGSQGWEILSSWGDAIWAVALGWGEAAWNGLASAGQAVWDTVATWSADVWSAASNWTQETWNNLLTSGTEVLQELKGISVDVARELASLPREAWDSATDFLTNVTDALAGAASGLVSAIYGLLPGGNPWTVEQAQFLSENGVFNANYVIADSAEVLSLAMGTGNADYLGNAAVVYHQDVEAANLTAVTGPSNIFMFSATQQPAEITNFSAGHHVDKLDVSNLLEHVPTSLDLGSTSEGRVVVLFEEAMQSGDADHVSALLDEGGVELPEDVAMIFLANASGNTDGWLWVDDVAGDGTIQQEELFHLVELIGVDHQALTEDNVIFG